MITSSSHINNYPNIFGVQKGFNPDQLAKAVSAGKSEGNPVDTLSISAPGNMMQQLLDLEMQGDSGTSAENAELDMTGLTQLKQRGDMLASMLKLKMQSFESNLVATMRGANVQPPADVNLKQGDEGLQLLGDMPQKEEMQNLMKNGSPLQNGFQDIANLNNVMQLLQQSGAQGAKTSGGFSSALHYAQQSLPARAAENHNPKDFILRVMQSGTDFSFE
ncbi:hypothetical protein FACS189419_08840 [Planctomycetales bacterium]|nr:hypothetical protein FACS189419_08840 [Planctomycetales bacterium]